MHAYSTSEGRSPAGGFADTLNAAEQRIKQMIWMDAGGHERWSMPPIGFSDNANGISLRCNSWHTSRAHKMHSCTSALADTGHESQRYGTDGSAIPLSLFIYGQRWGLNVKYVPLESWILHLLSELFTNLRAGGKELNKYLSWELHRLFLQYILINNS